MARPAQILTTMLSETRGRKDRLRARDDVHRRRPGLGRHIQADGLTRRLRPAGMGKLGTLLSRCQSGMTDFTSAEPELPVKQSVRLSKDPRRFGV